MRVLYLTYLPSPYRTAYFNELGKYCDLTVIYEKTKASHRENAWIDENNITFRSIVLKNGDSNNSIPKIAVIGVLRDNYDVIVIHNYSTATGILAIKFLHLMRKNFYIESDGGFAKDGLGIKEQLKKNVLKGAIGYFSTGKSCDEYYLTYGVPKEKIIRYPFTSLTRNDLDEARKRATDPNSKRILRTKLSIEEKFVVISVGQFIYRKAIDVLFTAMNQCTREIGIYIIGGKPTDEYLKMQEQYNLYNIHYVDFLSKEGLQDYYLAADVFVLPTREDIWGLVINEALSFGLPVITTDRCAAGLELIEQGKNGYLISVDDHNDLAKKITLLYYSDNLNELKYNSMKNISSYSIEEMARVHLDMFKTKTDNNTKDRAKL